MAIKLNIFFSKIFIKPIIKKAQNLCYYFTSSQQQIQDYYKILGVNKDSSSIEIKNAYYNLAQLYHPDKNPSKEAEVKFQKIATAYNILSNPSKKQNLEQYESFYDDIKYEDYSQFYKPKVEEDMGEYENINKETNNQTKGLDVMISHDIQFLDSVFGTKIKVKYTRVQVCLDCGGKKNRTGYMSVNCKQCQGSGKNMVRTGAVKLFTACSMCKGQGKYIKYPCFSCNGQGNKTIQENRELDVPIGIDSGQNLRYPGLGNIGNYNEEQKNDFINSFNKNKNILNGDLIIKINVACHKEFIRDGFNIISNAVITVAQAVLGDQIQINTIYGGQEKIDIRNGIQNDEKIILKNKGIQILNSDIKESQNDNSIKFGDHIINVKVKIPNNITNQMKTMYQQLKIMESK